MTEERWLPVVGYEGLYEVSDLGRVRSLDRYVMRNGGLASGRPMLLRGRILKLYRAKAGGYWSTGLCLEGVQTTYTVHGLVMAAFVGPRPEGQEVRHLDGDSGNCTLGNLAYGRPSENALDRVRHGTHNMTRKTQCKYGHEYTQENTYRHATGGRYCRACSLERARAARRAGCLRSGQEGAIACVVAS